MEKNKYNSAKSVEDLNKDFFLETASLISPYIHKTPVLTSSFLDEYTGSKAFLKCENFQKIGAFKMRGAMNAVLRMNSAEKQNGVTTHSSGNFAQALALAARNMKMKAYIVMPENATKAKRDAVAGYGAEIILCKPTLQAREDGVEKIIAQTGATFIHPYNNFHVIAGQGTATMELVEEYPNLDYILAPVGGGGLLSGTLLAANIFSPSTKVVAAEPLGANDAYRSLQEGYIMPSVQPQTIADGLLTSLGDLTFPIIQKYVSEIICVSDKEITAAMKFVWERMKIIIEPSSAAAVALLFQNNSIFQNKKVGIIISGGNVDLLNLPFNTI